MRASRAQREKPDRKRALVEAATRLFYEHGYTRVGVDQVAAEVGITGGGVYRHYRGKQELLARALFDPMMALHLSLDAVTGESPDELVDRIIDRLVVFVQTAREFPILAQRDSRYLTPSDRRSFNQLVESEFAHFAEVIAFWRPELPDVDADLLARAVVSACVSPSYHSVRLPSDKAAETLRRAARAIARSNSLPIGSHFRPPKGGRVLPTGQRLKRASRRAQLLTVAVELFGKRGYSAVRVEDIGMAASISGPSIYEYFTSKQDILVAALQRGANWLDLNLAMVLRSNVEPDQALGEVFRSYVRFALEHPHVIGVLFSEILELPAEQAQELRRSEREYVGELAALLNAARPTVSGVEALFTVHCALAVINNAVRDPQLRSRPDAEPVLMALVYEVLNSCQDAQVSRGDSAW